MPHLFVALERRLLVSLGNHLLQVLECCRSNFAQKRIASPLLLGPTDSHLRNYIPLLQKYRDTLSDHYLGKATLLFQLQICLLYLLALQPCTDQGVQRFASCFARRLGHRLARYFLRHLAHRLACYLARRLLHHLALQPAYFQQDQHFLVSSEQDKFLCA